MCSNFRHEPVALATSFIESRLQESLSIAEIAAVANLSQFHFQRLFFRSLGENVSEYVRKRRLERAANMLASHSAPSIIQVALDCGFETHSAFSKAFKKHFRVTPSVFSEEVAVRRGVSADDSRPFLKPIRRRSFEVEADFVELPQLWFHHRRQVGVVNGSYFPDSSSVMNAFKEVPTDQTESVWAHCGGFRNGPTGFNDDGADGYFGVIFLRDVAFDWGEDVAVIESGRWAVFPHFGDFVHLHLTWNKVCKNWLPARHITLRNEWMFESYLVPPGCKDPQRATAQLYVPIK